MFKWPALNFIALLRLLGYFIIIKYATAFEKMRNVEHIIEAGNEILCV